MLSRWDNFVVCWIFLNFKLISSRVVSAAHIHWILSCELQPFAIKSSVCGYWILKRPRFKGGAWGYHSVHRSIWSIGRSIDDSRTPGYPRPRLSLTEQNDKKWNLWQGIDWLKSHRREVFRTSSRSGIVRSFRQPRSQVSKVARLTIGYWTTVGKGVG